MDNIPDLSSNLPVSKFNSLMLYYKQINAIGYKLPQGKKTYVSLERNYRSPTFNLSDNLFVWDINLYGANINPSDNIALCNQRLTNVSAIRILPFVLPYSTLFTTELSRQIGIEILELPFRYTGNNQVNYQFLFNAVPMLTSHQLVNSEDSNLFILNNHISELTTISMRFNNLSRYITFQEINYLCTVSLVTNSLNSTYQLLTFTTNTVHNLANGDIVKFTRDVTTTPAADLGIVVSGWYDNYIPNISETPQYTGLIDPLLTQLTGFPITITSTTTFNIRFNLVVNSGSLLPSPYNASIQKDNLSISLEIYHL